MVSGKSSPLASLLHADPAFAPAGRKTVLALPGCKCPTRSGGPRCAALGIGVQSPPLGGADAREGRRSRGPPPSEPGARVLRRTAPAHKERITPTGRGATPDTTPAPRPAFQFRHGPLGVASRPKSACQMAPETSARHRFSKNCFGENLSRPRAVSPEGLPAKDRDLYPEGRREIPAERLRALFSNLYTYRRDARFFCHRNRYWGGKDFFLFEIRSGPAECGAERRGNETFLLRGPG